jgi:hypothetical protein
VVKTVLVGVTALVEALARRRPEWISSLRPSRFPAFFRFPFTQIPTQLRGQLAFAGAQPKPGSQQSIPGQPQVEEAVEPGQVRRSASQPNSGSGDQVGNVRVERWASPAPEAVKGV